MPHLRLSPSVLDNAHRRDASPLAYDILGLPRGYDAWISRDQDHWLVYLTAYGLAMPCTGRYESPEVGLAAVRAQLLSRHQG